LIAGRAIWSFCVKVPEVLNVSAGGFSSLSQLARNNVHPAMSSDDNLFMRIMLLYF
jgi:hypothetical protein